MRLRVQKAALSSIGICQYAMSVVLSTKQYFSLSTISRIMVDVIMMGDVMFTAPLHCLAAIAAGAAATRTRTRGAAAAAAAQLLPLPSPPETLKWRSGSSIQQIWCGLPDPSIRS